MGDMVLILTMVLRPACTAARCAQPGADGTSLTSANVGVLGR
jgi:hypothetical protein